MGVSNLRATYGRSSTKSYPICGNFQYLSNTAIVSTKSSPICGSFQSPSNMLWQWLRPNSAKCNSISSISIISILTDRPTDRHHLYRAPYYQQCAHNNDSDDIWLVHVLRSESLLHNRVLEGRIEETRTLARQWYDDRLDEEQRRGIWPYKEKSSC